MFFFAYSQAFGKDKKTQKLIIYEILLFKNDSNIR